MRMLMNVTMPHGKRRAGAQCQGFSLTRDRHPVPETRLPEGL
jgi:hypothetical protein